MVIIDGNFFIIKRFLLILILTFSFLTLTKADDIRDFQIEGMSIGDSLLDYFSETEIKKNKRSNAYRWKKNRKFISIEINSHSSFKNYDAIQASYKTNNKEFKIDALSGVIAFPFDSQKCYKKKDEIVKELSEIFKDIATKNDLGTSKHSSDDSGKSTHTTVRFQFNSSDMVRVSCTDWSKEMLWTDHLRVEFVKKEFLDWIKR